MSQIGITPGPSAGRVNLSAGARLFLEDYNEKAGVGALLEDYNEWANLHFGIRHTLQGVAVAACVCLLHCPFLLLEA